MRRAISNRNVCDATFKVAEFQGEWLASIGKPELRGAWTIFGESGSGKTHLALSLLKYLTGFVKRCAYNTLEQGLSKSFQTAWNDTDMQSVGTKVIVYDKMPIEEMKEHLRRRKSPDVIVIDSVSALVGFTRPAFAKLINEFPDKLFIFIAHEENNKPHPAIAQFVRKMSEVKIRCVGYKANVTTRFKTADGGGEDLIIWQEGADEYWAENL